VVYQMGYPDPLIPETSEAIRPIAYRADESQPKCRHDMIDQVWDWGTLMVGKRVRHSLELNNEIGLRQPARPN
jgi:hypothetical protein